ncbi:hypothetical protein D3C72_2019300 [compost metagenome]
MHGLAFHCVVVHGAGAMQVDPADVGGHDVGVLQGGKHGLPRARAGGLGRRHVPGVRTGAAAQQGHGIGIAGRAFHHEQDARFADVDATAVG